MNAPWHVYPEQAATGLWTTPSDLARFAIEVQPAIHGPAGVVLNQATAREMIAPVGLGSFAFGLEISKTGEGWYFSHSGGLGISLPPAGSRPQRLWSGDHDQQRFGRPGNRRNRIACRRLRLGYSRQADLPVKSKKSAAVQNGCRFCWAQI
jgi:CubicO group peptidase (beta-lactamase class C family)